MDKKLSLIVGGVLIILAVLAVLCCGAVILFGAAVPDPEIGGIVATPIPSADQLIMAMQKAGLEVAEIQPIGDLPKGGVDGLKFYTPGLCDGCSSMVIIFKSEAAALETKAMMEQASQANEAFRFHLYQSGRVLLRMGGLIEENQAARYARAIGVD